MNPRMLMNVNRRIKESRGLEFNVLLRVHCMMHTIDDSSTSSFLPPFLSRSLRNYECFHVFFNVYLNNKTNNLYFPYSTDTPSSKSLLIPSCKTLLPVTLHLRLKMTSLPSLLFNKYMYMGTFLLIHAIYLSTTAHFTKKKQDDSTSRLLRMVYV